MCTVLLPPGVNPIAVNKYIYICLAKNKFREAMMLLFHTLPAYYHHKSCTLSQKIYCHT